MRKDEKDEKDENDEGRKSMDRNFTIIVLSFISYLTLLFLSQ